MNCSTDTLKSNLSPDVYYGNHLSGSYGKPTGQGWHMWNGLCPFHKDKRAGSLVINRVTGAFKCFSCGEAGGDVIAFHMKYNDLNFKEAFEQLQEVFKCVK